MSIELIDTVAKEDLNCVVCREPFVNQKVMVCCRGEHNLCKSCATLIQPAKCPIDREVGAFIPDPRRERMCAKLAVGCTHRFCRFLTFPWLLEEHLEECVFRKVVCPLCEKSVGAGAGAWNEDEKEANPESFEVALYHHYREGCRKKWHITSLDEQDSEIQLLPASSFSPNRLVMSTSTQTLLFFESIPYGCKTSIGRLFKCFAFSYRTTSVPCGKQTISIGDRQAVQVNVPRVWWWREQENVQAMLQSAPVVMVPREQTIHLIQFTVKAILDALDTRKLWLEAEIIEVDHTKERVKIHYLKWSAKWDEWIGFDSNRLAPHRTFTTGENVVTVQT